MIYGYARVSTAAQDESGQVRQLKAAGCEKVFRENFGMLNGRIVEIDYGGIDPCFSVIPRYARFLM